MARGEIPYGRYTEKSLCAGRRTPAVIILPKVDIDVELIIIRVFNAGSQFRHQRLLRIENIAYSGSKSIGKSPLLKDIEIRPKFKVVGSILALHPCEIGSSVVDTQTEYIPLPPEFESEIRFFAKAARIVRYAWGQGNICLRETPARNQANQGQYKTSHVRKVSKINLRYGEPGLLTPVVLNCCWSNEAHASFAQQLFLG